MRPINNIHALAFILLILAHTIEATWEEGVIFAPSLEELLTTDLQPKFTVKEVRKISRMFELYVPDAGTKAAGGLAGEPKIPPVVHLSPVRKNGFKKVLLNVFIKREDTQFGDHATKVLDDEKSINPSSDNANVTD